MYKIYSSTWTIGKVPIKCPRPRSGSRIDSLLGDFDSSIVKISHVLNSKLIDNKRSFTTFKISDTSIRCPFFRPTVRLLCVRYVCYVFLRLSDYHLAQSTVNPPECPSFSAFVNPFLPSFLAPSLPVI